MLYSALEQVVTRFPDRIAVHSEESDCTYRDLWNQSELLALKLVEEGVVDGDRVAILSENSVQSVVAWWAIVKLNAISVNVNNKLKPAGFEYIIEDAAPVLFLCGSKKMVDLLPSSEKCWNLSDVVVAGSKNSLSVDTLPSRDASIDTIASIVYTSGSTGNPKGVCLTHRNLLSVGNIAANGFGLTEADKYLMIVPLHYIHGLMMLMSLQLRGASLDFMSSFMFPTSVTKRLKNGNFTGFSGVPFHLTALMDRGEFLVTEFPKLRWVCITGGTFTPDRICSLNQHQPQLEIHIAYGQTECSPRITMLDPARVIRKPTSVGSVAPGLTIDFLDEQGNSVPQGQTGELVVSGDNVMHGYWNDDAATAKVIDRQGRLRTGDLAYQDEEGDVYIRGRVQAMIKSAGERIFPEELEAVLIKHPDVESVAVVGEDDSLYGQIVVAHLVLLPNQNVNDATILKSIEAACLDEVPFARAPRKYHLWEEFPLKANGKIDKPLLSKLYNER